MSSLTKIRRDKDNQLEQYNVGRVNPNDTSFFPWVKQLLGKLNLFVNRKFYDPHNVLQWTLPVAGQVDDITTIHFTNDYGIKFNTEILRGDIARVANIDGYNMWSFVAGVAGAYEVDTLFKIVFPDQSTADAYYVHNLQFSEPTLTLAINGTLLTHPMAWDYGLLEDGVTMKLKHYLSGSQRVLLNAGDRLNVFLNLHGFVSVKIESFTTYGHVGVNFLTKKSRIINPQTV